jgi:hypothetical protein
MPRADPSSRGRAERGVTLVEVLVALLLTVIVVLGALAMLDASTRDHLRILELASTESRGRVAMEILAADVAVAGYDPLGALFDAIPAGDESSLRLLADLDGDGDVGTAGEPDENVTWGFLDGDGDGRYVLRRGVDLDGDGDFDDESESVEEVATGLVRPPPPRSSRSPSARGRAATSPSASPTASGASSLASPSGTGSRRPR